MKEYTATFHSHFGAVKFNHNLKRMGITCALRPVPRALSSSCGTCAVFESEEWNVTNLDDVEGIYIKEKDRWLSVYETSEN
ncbi:MAG: DUF3343 domain-containing protein [Sphaerochaetaceae bacterium]|nr:DUF3343 domain-containing protein [Sphaerochaetaceae bacterium]